MVNCDFFQSIDRLATSYERVAHELQNDDAQTDNVNQNIEISEPSFINGQYNPCKFCKKIYKWEKKYYDHKNFHSKKFKCEICSRCFTTENALNTHRAKEKCKRKAEEPIANRTPKKPRRDSNSK